MCDFEANGKFAIRQQNINRLVKSILISTQDTNGLTLTMNFDFGDLLFPNGQSMGNQPPSSFRAQVDRAIYLFLTSKCHKTIIQPTFARTDIRTVNIQLIQAQKPTINSTTNFNNQIERVEHLVRMSLFNVQNSNELQTMYVCVYMWAPKATAKSTDPKCGS